MITNSHNAQKRPTVILLMGATASGKTGLAMELYHHLPIRIINVDSVQFYRQFNIGSAKPTASERQTYDMHMIDICDPDDAYSVSRFCVDVEKEIQLALEYNKIPLLTGGSMMYFKSLTQGLSPMPEAHQEIRRHLQQEKRNKGLAHLHKQLLQIDPHTATRLSPKDSQRIVRALEVFLASGKTISELHRTGSVVKHKFVTFALSNLSRHELHKRIEDRFYAMLKAGFINEVEQLQKRWSRDLDKPAFRAVGYRQILDYLNDEYDYQTMIDKGLSATRQLAKRQLTWLRLWPEIKHLNCRNKQELVKQVVTITDLSLPSKSDIRSNNKLTGDR